MRGLPWPLLAALTVGLAAMGAILFTPASARLALVPPRFELAGLARHDGADGTPYVIVVERDAGRGAATDTDRVTRLTTRAAGDGAVRGARTVDGAAWPERGAAPERSAAPDHNAASVRSAAPGRSAAPDREGPAAAGAPGPRGDRGNGGARGAARSGTDRLWLRFADGRPARPVALPSLADAPAPGRAPRGPTPDFTLEPCLVRRVDLPSGRVVKLPDGERVQIDPGPLPGETAPPAPAPTLDAHGHAIGPALETGRGPTYVEPAFLCERTARGRAAMLVERDDLLVLHRAVEGRTRTPVLSRATSTAEPRWTLDLAEAVPRALRGGGELEVRWVDRTDADHLVLAVEHRRGTAHRWALLGVDLARGAADYAVIVAEPSR